MRAFLLRVVPLLALGLLPAQAGVHFRVASFNLQNYLLSPADGRQPKTAEARVAVQQTIRALNPDVLALQEIGGLDALHELRASLKRTGLDFPYWEHVNGFDTNVQVAVLSRLMLTGRRSHTNETFLLGGHRMRISRGFAEVDVRVNANYSFTLLAAHLKSKRPVAIAEESELRLEEARRLRQIIETRLTADPELNLVVLGDFNDTQDSAPLRAIVGRGKLRLIDTRPFERWSNENLAPLAQARVTWTYHFAQEDSYSRVDYILLSPGMAGEWHAGESYVLASPNWGLASDHRPLVATFEAPD